MKDKRKKKYKDNIDKHNKRREFMENTIAFKDIVRTIFTYVSKYDLDKTRKLGKYGNEEDYAKNKRRVANGGKALLKDIKNHDFSRKRVKDSIEKLVFGNLRIIARETPKNKPTGISKMIINEMEGFEKNPKYYEEVDDR